MEDSPYRWGRYFPIGIGIGIALGIPIGLALGNIALGPALGVALGSAIGLFLEQYYNPESSQSAEELEKSRRQLTVGYTILLVAGILLFVLLFLFLE